MKKIMITILVVLSMLIAINFSNADSMPLESYYNDYITKKIFKCERIALMANSKSKYIQRWAKMRDLQAKFFRNNREKLVNDMVAQNIQMKPYKVDYFLIKAFLNAHPKLAAH